MSYGIILTENVTKMRQVFLQPNDPLLITIAQEVPVEKIASPETRKNIAYMQDIAYGQQKNRKKAVLVGLAAPQVGISKRIILVDIGADGHGEVSDLKTYINPEIIWQSKTKKEWYEGCYSTDRVCGIVSRSTSIKVKALTPTGETIEEKYLGYVARIFQHEIDHLNGKEFVSHIIDNTKLHWVEDKEFPLYRDKEAWRTWRTKCTREKWEKIKGITK